MTVSEILLRYGTEYAKYAQEGYVYVCVSPPLFLLSYFPLFPLSYYSLHFPPISIALFIYIYIYFIFYIFIISVCSIRARSFQRRNPPLSVSREAFLVSAVSISISIHPFLSVVGVEMTGGNL